MTEDQKIIELKRKINHDDFRDKQKEIKELKKRKKHDTPKKKKRKFNVVNFVFVLFVMYFAYTAFNQHMMINDLNELISERNVVKATVEKEADILKQDVENMNNDEALLDLVEKVARDQYKMVKPNEIIYIDKNKNKNKFIQGIGLEEDVMD